MKKMINLCPKCGFFATNLQNSYCPNCGGRLINKCPECSTPLNYPLARYCAVCGADLRASKKKRKEAK